MAGALRRAAGMAPTPSGGEARGASPGRWSRLRGNLVPAGAAGGAGRRKGVVPAGEARGCPAGRAAGSAAGGVVWWRGRHKG